MDELALPLFPNRWCKKTWNKEFELSSSDTVQDIFYIYATYCHLAEMGFIIATI